MVLKWFDKIQMRQAQYANLLYEIEWLKNSKEILGWFVIPKLLSLLVLGWRWYIKIIDLCTQYCRATLSSMLFSVPVSIYHSDYAPGKKRIQWILTQSLYSRNSLLDSIEDNKIHLHSVQIMFVLKLVIFQFIKFKSLDDTYKIAGTYFWLLCPTHCLSITMHTAQCLHECGQQAASFCLY
jgi:hypothetical protein